MLQITTTFVGATDFKGEKIIVKGPHGQLTVSYDYGQYDMHDAAVLAYLIKHNMPNGFVRNAHDQRRTLTRSGRGYRYLLLGDLLGDHHGEINGLLYAR